MYEYVGIVQGGVCASAIGKATSVDVTMSAESKQDMFLEFIKAFIFSFSTKSHAYIIVYFSYLKNPMLLPLTRPIYPSKKDVIVTTF